MTSINLHTAEDILLSVPALIGHQPTDDHVALLLDANYQLIVTTRNDITEGTPIDYLVSMLKKTGGHRIILITYSSEPMPRLTEGEMIGVRLEEELNEYKFIDWLNVSQGRYFSRMCSNEKCCPPEGNEVPVGVSDLELAELLNGNKIAGSRDELVDRYKMQEQRVTVQNWPILDDVIRWISVKAIVTALTAKPEAFKAQ